MNINTIERISTLVQQLKLIEDDIQIISTLANKVANDKCDIAFNIGVESELDAKVKIDDDGDMVKSTDPSYNLAKGLGLWSMNTKEAPSTTKTDKYSFKLKDTECLMALGAILGARYEQRGIIIGKLEKVGITCS